MSTFVVSNKQRSGEFIRAELRVRISSDDLIRLLELDGGRVIGSDEHGAFVHVQHRLLFIRRAAVVDARDLRDALRSAQMGPGRFDILLEKLHEGVAEEQCLPVQHR
jgi:hypothetical protein